MHTVATSASQITKKNILFIKQPSLVDICFGMPKNILIEQSVLDTNAEK